MGNHVNHFANVHQGHRRRVGRSPGPEGCPKQRSGLVRLIKDDVSGRFEPRLTITRPTGVLNTSKEYGTDIEQLCRIFDSHAI